MVCTIRFDGRPVASTVARASTPGSLTPSSTAVLSQCCASAVGSGGESLLDMAEDLPDAGGEDTGSVAGEHGLGVELHGREVRAAQGVHLAGLPVAADLDPVEG